jgi:hypothetical protein
VLAPASPARHAHPTAELPFYDTGRLVWTMALADSIAGTAEYQSEALNVLLRTQFTE